VQREMFWNSLVRMNGGLNLSPISFQHNSTVVIQIQKPFLFCSGNICIVDPGLLCQRDIAVLGVGRISRRGILDYTFFTACDLSSCDKNHSSNISSLSFPITLRPNTSLSRFYFLTFQYHPIASHHQPTHNPLLTAVVRSSEP
jgi:hypothetical protein